MPSHPLTSSSRLTKRVRFLHDRPDLFADFAGSLQLRPYQLEPIAAILHSIRHQLGFSFVVIFPRQSGKNETQAALFTQLLFMTQKIGGDIVSVSPTYKPQTENAMRRLEARISTNQLTRGRWKKRGYVYRLGDAQLTFFSGDTTAKVVGNTASLLLSVDEAQDVSIPKYDKDFEPMVASTNATRVFWGTRWTSDTLLEREYANAQRLQRADGRRRIFFATADDVTPILPAYAAHVQAVIRKHGRDHPLVKTQYFGETIDAQSGMFTPARLALLTAPADWTPPADMALSFLIDVAGTDEAQRQGDDYLTNPGRDSTTLSIAAIDLSELATLQAPIYRIFQRHSWQGTDPVTIFSHLAALAEQHRPQYFVVDGTGVGDGLAALLSRKFGPARVLVIHFTARVKSDLGYRLLSIVNTARLRLHAFPATVRLQYAHARAEVLPGPGKTMRWGVPESSRDKQSGELIHDDFLLADALTAELDRLSWFSSSPTTVIELPDPLEPATNAF